MCAWGGPTVYDATGNYLAGAPMPLLGGAANGGVDLSASDCQSLLALDPFYSGQGQSTALVPGGCSGSSSSQTGRFAVISGQPGESFHGKHNTLGLTLEQIKTASAQLG